LKRRLIVLGCAVLIGSAVLVGSMPLTASPTETVPEVRISESVNQERGITQGDSLLEAVLDEDNEGSDWLIEANGLAVTVIELPAGTLEMP
jgi:hypothetical protein